MSGHQRHRENPNTDWLFRHEHFVSLSSVDWVWSGIWLNIKWFSNFYTGLTLSSLTASLSILILNSQLFHNESIINSQYRHVRELLVRCRTIRVFFLNCLNFSAQKSSLKLQRCVCMYVCMCVNVSAGNSHLFVLWWIEKLWFNGIH